ncbi:hypothetical protein Peur_006335 [Populus x canadensis]
MTILQMKNFRGALSSTTVKYMLIYVKDLLTSGVQNGTAELHRSKYRVVDASQSYVGEVQVGVTFTLKGTEMILFHRMLASVILSSTEKLRSMSINVRNNSEQNKVKSMIKFE